MKPRDCTRPHLPRRVVLTGGPGAGKTAVLAMLRDEVTSCWLDHVRTFLWDGDTRRAPLGPADGSGS